MGRAVAEGVEQGGQTNVLPRRETAPEWQYPSVADDQFRSWTNGGASSKRAVTHALEIAMLDHAQRLLHGSLATPDQRNIIQFEAGLRRLKDLDKSMREVVDRVYPDVPH
jgi:hypothetical protein